MTLGERIKIARKRLGKTQQEIGDAFDITDKAVSAWERDPKSKPEFEKLPKLARVLKVPLAWLVDGTGDPPPEDNLLVRIEALSAADRAYVDTMVEALQAKSRQVA